MVRETRHLWVGNLPENISEDRIREHFKRYGPVQSVKFLSGNDEGVCAAIAFVDICSAAKAHKADHRLDERLLKTTYYEPTLTALTATHYASSGSHRDYSAVSSQANSHVPHGARSPRFSSGLNEEHNSYERSSHFYESRRDETIGYNGPGVQVGGGGGGMRRPYPGDQEFATGGRGRVRSYPSRGHFLPNGRAEPTEYRWSGGGGGVGQYRFHNESYNPEEPKIRRIQGGPVSPPPHVPRGGAVRGVHRANKRRMVGGTSRSGSDSPSSSSRSSSSSSSSSNSSRSSSSRSGSPGIMSSRSNSRSPRRLGSTSQPLSLPALSSPSDKRALAICIKNLPVWSTDTSLKDGLFHDYKKHGKVTLVRIFGSKSDRYAVVCFKKSEDAEKALEASQDKQFFGVDIQVSLHEGLELDENEFRTYDNELDEYHPKATRTLFIGGLDKEVTATELRKHFEPFGEIIEIDIKKQNSSTYAFCQYSDIRSVVQAVKKMDGEHLCGNRIKLGFGKSMPNRCIWVGGVADSLTETSLCEQFNRFGAISHRNIDREKGHALIAYESERHASAAVTEMRGVLLSGKKLQIDFASRECQVAFFENLNKQEFSSPSDRTTWERRDSEKYDRSRRDQYVSRQLSNQRLQSFSSSSSRSRTRYESFEDYTAGRNYDEFADDSFERDLHEYAGRQRYENGPTTAAVAPSTTPNSTTKHRSPIRKRDDRSPHSPQPILREPESLSPLISRAYDDLDCRKSVRHRSISDQESFHSQSPPPPSNKLSPRGRARMPSRSPSICSPSREVTVMDERNLSDPRRRKPGELKDIVVRVSDHRRPSQSPLRQRINNHRIPSDTDDSEAFLSKTELHDPRLLFRRDELFSSGDERSIDGERPNKKCKYAVDSYEKSLKNPIDYNYRPQHHSNFRKPFDSRKIVIDKFKKDGRCDDTVLRSPPTDPRQRRPSEIDDRTPREVCYPENEFMSDVSPPGTPVRDEREDPEIPLPIHRRIPKEKHLCMSLPLPKFALHFRFHSSPRTVTNSPRAITTLKSPSFSNIQSNFSLPPLEVVPVAEELDPILADTPVSPGPALQDPPSDSEESANNTPPGSAALYERIKALDEKYEKWTGNARSMGKTLSMNRQLSLHHETLRINSNKKRRIPELKELRSQEPSAIVKSVLSKRSIFDEDSKRLENISDKYEPKPFSSVPKAKAVNMTSSLLPSGPAHSSSSDSTSIPSATPLSSLPGMRIRSLNSPRSSVSSSGVKLSLPTIVSPPLPRVKTMVSSPSNTLVQSSSSTASSSAAEVTSSTSLSMSDKKGAFPTSNSCDVSPISNTKHQSSSAVVVSPTSENDAPNSLSIPTFPHSQMHNIVKSEAEVTSEVTTCTETKPSLGEKISEVKMEPIESSTNELEEETSLCSPVNCDKKILTVTEQIQNLIETKPEELKKVNHKDHMNNNSSLRVEPFGIKMEITPTMEVDKKENIKRRLSSVNDSDIIVERRHSRDGPKPSLDRISEPETKKIKLEHEEEKENKSKTSSKDKHEKKNKSSSYTRKEEHKVVDNVIGSHSRDNGESKSKRHHDTKEKVEAKELKREKRKERHEEKEKLASKQNSSQCLEKSSKQLTEISSTQHSEKSISLNTHFSSDKSSSSNEQLSDKNNSQTSEKISINPKNNCGLLVERNNQVSEKSTCQLSVRSKVQHSEKSSTLSHKTSNQFSEKSSHQHFEKSSQYCEKSSSIQHCEKSNNPHSEKSSNPHSEKSNNPHSEKNNNPHSEKSSNPHSEKSSNPHSEKSITQHSEKSITQHFEKSSNQHTERSATSNQQPEKCSSQHSEKSNTLQSEKSSSQCPDRSSTSNQHSDRSSSNQHLEKICTQHSDKIIDFQPEDINIHHSEKMSSQYPEKSSHHSIKNINHHEKVIQHSSDKHRPSDRKVEEYSNKKDDKDRIIRYDHEKRRQSDDKKERSKDKVRDRDRHRISQSEHEKRDKSRNKERSKHKSKSEDQIRRHSGKDRKEHRENTSDNNLLERSLSKKSKTKSSLTDYEEEIEKSHRSRDNEQQLERTLKELSRKKHDSGKSEKSNEDSSKHRVGMQNYSSSKNIYMKSKSQLLDEEDNIDSEEPSSDEDTKCKLQPAKRTKQRATSSSSGSRRGRPSKTKSILDTESDTIDSESDSDQDKPKKASYFDITIYDGNMYDKVKARRVRSAQSKQQQHQEQQHDDDLSKPNDFKQKLCSKRSKKLDGSDTDDSDTDIMKKRLSGRIHSSSEDEMNMYSEESDSIHSKSENKKSSSVLDKIKKTSRIMHVSDITTDDENMDNHRSISGSESDYEPRRNRNEALLKIGSDSEHSDAGTPKPPRPALSVGRARLSEKEKINCLVDKSKSSIPLPVVSEVRYMKPKVRRPEPLDLNKCGKLESKERKEGRMTAIFGLMSDDSDSNAPPTTPLSSADLISATSYRKSSSSSGTSSDQVNPQTRIRQSSSLFESDDDVRPSTPDLSNKLRTDSVDVPENIKDCGMKVLKDDIISATWREAAVKEAVCDAASRASDSGKGSSSGVSTASSSSGSSAEELLLLESMNANVFKEEPVEKKPFVFEVTRKDKKKKKKHKEKEASRLHRHSSKESHDKTHFIDESASHPFKFSQTEENSLLIKEKSKSFSKEKRSSSSRSSKDSSSKEISPTDCFAGLVKKSSSLDLTSKPKDEVLKVDKAETPSKEENTPLTASKAPASDSAVVEVTVPKPSRSTISQEETLNAVAGLLACYNDYQEDDEEPSTPAEEEPEVPVEVPPPVDDPNEQQSEEAQKAAQMLQSEMPEERVHNWNAIDASQASGASATTQNPPRDSVVRSPKVLKVRPESSTKEPHILFPDSPSSVQSEEPALQIDEDDNHAEFLDDRKCRNNSISTNLLSNHPLLTKDTCIEKTLPEDIHNQSLTPKSMSPTLPPYENKTECMRNLEIKPSQPTTENIEVIKCSVEPESSKLPNHLSKESEFSADISKAQNESLKLSSEIPFESSNLSSEVPKVPSESSKLISEISKVSTTEKSEILSELPPKVTTQISKLSNEIIKPSTEDYKLSSKVSEVCIEDSKDVKLNIKETKLASTESILTDRDQPSQITLNNSIKTEDDHKLCSSSNLTTEQKPNDSLMHKETNTASVIHEYKPQPYEFMSTEAMANENLLKAEHSKEEHQLLTDKLFHSTEEKSDKPEDEVRVSYRGRGRGRGKRGGYRSTTESLSPETPMITRSCIGNRHPKGRGRSKHFTDDDDKAPDQLRRSTRTKKATKHPDMVEHDETTNRRRRGARGGKVGEETGIRNTMSSCDIYDFHESDDDLSIGVGKKSKKPATPTQSPSKGLDESFEGEALSPRKSRRLRDKGTEEDSSVTSDTDMTCDETTSSTVLRIRRKAKKDNEDEEILSPRKSPRSRSKNSESEQDTEKEPRSIVVSQESNPEVVLVPKTVERLPAISPSVTVTPKTLIIPCHPSKPQLESLVTLQTTVPLSSQQQQPPSSLSSGYSQPLNPMKLSIVQSTMRTTGPKGVMPGTSVVPVLAVSSLSPSTTLPREVVVTQTSLASSPGKTVIPVASLPASAFKAFSNGRKPDMPTPLVDPVTGHLTPMKISDEGHYIPIAGEHPARAALMALEGRDKLHHATKVLRAVIPGSAIKNSGSSLPPSLIVSNLSKGVNVATLHRGSEVSVELVSRSRPSTIAFTSASVQMTTAKGVTSYLQQKSGPVTMASHSVVMSSHLSGSSNSPSVAPVSTPPKTITTNALLRGTAVVGVSVTPIKNVPTNKMQSTAVTKIVNATSSAGIHRPNSEYSLLTSIPVSVAPPLTTVARVGPPLPSVISLPKALEVRQQSIQSHMSSKMDEASAQRLYVDERRGHMKEFVTVPSHRFQDPRYRDVPIVEVSRISGVSPHSPSVRPIMDPGESAHLAQQQRQHYELQQRAVATAAAAPPPNRQGVRPLPLVGAKMSHFFSPSDLHAKSLPPNEYLASPPLHTPPSAHTPPPAHHHIGQREAHPIVFHPSPYMAPAPRSVYGENLPIDLKTDEKDSRGQPSFGPNRTVITPHNASSPHQLSSPHYDRSTDSPQVTLMHPRRYSHFDSNLYPTRSITPGSMEHDGLPRSPLSYPPPIAPGEARVPYGSPAGPPPTDNSQYLLQDYPVMWEGILGLKNDQAQVKMHFISGSLEVARGALRISEDHLSQIKISQRMRLEQSQLEGVARKMQMEAEHCILMALPFGNNHLNNIQQRVILENGFIKYLGDKKAAGIVNVSAPGSHQSAYVIHIFPPCDFANENLIRIAPELLHGIGNSSRLLVVIATC